MRNPRTPHSLPASRRRRILGGAAAFVLAIGTAVIGAPSASAVHDVGLFQLDGNAQTSVQSTPPANDDWDRVCHQAAPTICPTGSNTTDATAVSFTNDGAQNASIFTGGGSKDPQDISNWQWKDQSGGLPDKDNLQNSFAARYQQSGNDYLYFGSDRFDNSGDAQEGFWFFQNKITLNPNGTFNGVHKVGDLLILSDFSNGGTTSTINIYTWVGTGGDTNGTLQFLAGGTAAKCGGSANDAFCGIVNPTNGTPVPWPFTDKSGNTTYLNGEFYEGGVNLTNLGLGGECFASVSSETRSSTSPTATLKDFVLGNFGECGSKTETTPLKADGSTIPAEGLSITTAGTVLVKDSAKVTATGGAGIKPTGTVSFFICGPTAANSTALCDTGGTAVGVRTLNGTDNPAIVESDVVTVSSAGRYCFRADYSGDAAKGIPGSSDSAATECFLVTPVQPTLTTSAGDDVFIGSPVTDTATLTGTAPKPGTPVINPTTPGGPAGGSITFSLFGPSDSGCGPLVGTVGPVAVNGDGTYGPVSLTPTAVGTYHWVASYTGDLPNTLSDSHNSDCTDGNENVVVKSVKSSLFSQQTWVPNDSVTVSAPEGGNLSGSVTFELHTTGDCSGAAAYSVTRTVAGASPQTVSTANTTAFGTSGSFSWLVNYDSTNPAQEDIPATCLETSALTINNGGTISSP